MKLLDFVETKAVCGGDYDFIVTLLIPSAVHAQYYSLYQGFVSLTPMDLPDEVKAMNVLACAGNTLDQIELLSIHFTNISQ